MITGENPILQPPGNISEDKLHDSMDNSVPSETEVEMQTPMKCLDWSPETEFAVNITNFERQQLQLICPYLAAA